METETDGKLPFLDVLLSKQRSSNNECSCITSVFRKKAYTGLLTSSETQGQSVETRRDETRIGTGVKFSSKARRAPGNIPLPDEFQSELNSDFLIGRKFPQLSFFRPIREPHTMKSDRDSLYQVIDTTSMVAIFFLSLSLTGSQNTNRHTMQRKFGSQRIQPILPRRFCYVGQLSVHV